MGRHGNRCFLGVLVLVLVTAMVGCGGGGGSSSGGGSGADFDSGPETSPAGPLGRGINMGNMLEATPDEESWGERVEESYFALIKSRGFTTVRIPIRWSLPNRTATTAPYTISPTFFQRVDEVIGWAEEQGLNIIINVHHYDELFENPDAHSARFIAMWQQIATRYRDKDPQKFYYEILNEPHGNLTVQRWNTLLRNTITAIRAIDANQTLILTGANWGGASALNDLQIPEGENNVIATFHFYSPFNFTHQGADWTSPIPPLGTTWPGSNVKSACRAIQNELDIALNWSRSHNNIPVLLGEFGAYEKADMQSRINWTAYVRKQAESRGFSFTYWEFCSGFGIYNNSTGQWNEGLVTALGGY